MAGRRGQDWSGILSRAGLEAPGYEEAVESTIRKTAERNRREAERLNKKSKRKPKR